MNLIDKLKRDEGLRLSPYLCTAGKTTIGYGRNLDDVGISEEEAEHLLANDVLRITNQLRRGVLFFDDLPPRIQDVLINMGFNLGIVGLLKFKNMLQALDDEDYEKAASEALNSRWAGQVGQRAVRLSEEIKGD